VAGSTPFSLETSGFFERSFKKLCKNYNEKFVETLSATLEELIGNPYPLNAADEPLPSRMKLPEGWTFHKLRFKIGKGASGLIRLIYLVNEKERRIKPFWMYSHEQFEKRPSDKDLAKALKEVLGE